MNETNQTMTLSAGFPLWAQQLRVRHWVKNLLLLVPLVSAHRFLNLAEIGLLAMAFASFCLAASLVYLLNDCLDLSSDQGHPLKKNRPLADGRIRLQQVFQSAGFLTLSLGLIASLGILPAKFILLLFSYIGLSLIYSFSLKKIAYADVVVLSLLYNLRILAGHFLFQITPSWWFLSFSFFLFVSLALLKRNNELLTYKKSFGRSYTQADQSTLRALGWLTAGVSVLILAFYLQSTKATQVYTAPEKLWPLLLIFSYWISRLWIKSSRGDLEEDPVMAVVKDRQTYALILLLFLNLSLAI